MPLLRTAQAIPAHARIIHPRSAERAMPARRLKRKPSIATVRKNVSPMSRVRNCPPRKYPQQPAAVSAVGSQQSAVLEPCEPRQGADEEGARDPSGSGTGGGKHDGSVRYGPHQPRTEAEARSVSMNRSALRGADAQLSVACRDRYTIRNAKWKTAEKSCPGRCTTGRIPRSPSR